MESPIKKWSKNFKRNNKMKRQPTEQEKIFANHMSDKELISIVYKELIHSKAKL